MQIGISLVFEKSPEFRKKCVNTYSNLRLGDTTGRGQHTADRMTSYFRKTESSERATRDANNVVLSSGRATGTFLVYWEAYRLSRDASALRQFWVLLPLTLGLDSNCSAKRNAQRFQMPWRPAGQRSGSKRVDLSAPPFRRAAIRIILGYNLVIRSGGMQPPFRVAAWSHRLGGKPEKHL